VAEHDFLVYNSLASADLALSTPNPIMKIADVAGGGEVPYLEAAVGRPLEWDQVVPYFGRREIVKGSVYSYYEFPSSTPLTDLDWAGKLANPDADPANPATADKAVPGKVETPGPSGVGQLFHFQGEPVMSGSTALLSSSRSAKRMGHGRDGHSHFGIAILPHFSLPAASAQPAPGDFRLLFTGDVMMSRLVKAEIDQRKTNPWAGFTDLFHSASLVGGNFEGALGDPAKCPAENKLCFAAPDAAAELMRQAGFRLVTAENNHSGDLGQAGRNETRAAFQQSGLLALDFDSSPQFFRFGELTVGFVAVTTIKAADGRVQQVPSVELAQKLRLARQLANLVWCRSIGATNCRIGRPMRSSSRRAGWSSMERTLSSGIIPMLSRLPHVSRAGQSSSRSATIFSTRSMPRPRTA
jgi:hypothetical protein